LRELQDKLRLLLDDFKQQNAETADHTYGHMILPPQVAAELLTTLSKPRWGSVDDFKTLALGLGRMKVIGPSLMKLYRDFRHLHIKDVEPLTEEEIAKLTATANRKQNKLQSRRQPQAPAPITDWASTAPPQSAVSDTTPQRSISSTSIVVSSTDRGRSTPGTVGGAPQPALEFSSMAPPAARGPQVVVPAQSGIKKTILQFGNQPTASVTSADLTAAVPGIVPPPVPLHPQRLEESQQPSLPYATESMPLWNTVLSAGVSPVKNWGTVTAQTPPKDGSSCASFAPFQPLQPHNNNEIFVSSQQSSARSSKTFFSCDSVRNSAASSCVVDDTNRGSGDVRAAVGEDIDEDNDDVVVDESKMLEQHRLRLSRTV
jgi:hypothetical protein